jgi:hypothetical protein
MFRTYIVTFMITVRVLTKYSTVSLEYYENIGNVSSYEYDL